MANYLGMNMQNVPEYKVHNVLAPAGGLKAGNIVMLGGVPTGGSAIDGNYQVLSAVQPTTANMVTNKIAVVVTGGNFETLDDGRLPEGQPNYLQYEYKEGQVAPVVLLDDGMIFQISDEALTSATAATVGGFIVPANGTYNATSVATATDTNYKQALKIVAKKNFRMGGQFGGNFITTSVAMAVTL